MKFAIRNKFSNCLLFISISPRIVLQFYFLQYARDNDAQLPLISILRSKYIPERRYILIRIISTWYCTNHLYSRPSPGGAGRETAGKMCRIHKKKQYCFPQSRAKTAYIYIDAPVICNHAQAPGKIGDFDFQSESE